MSIEDIKFAKMYQQHNFIPFSLKIWKESLHEMWPCLDKVTPVPGACHAYIYIYISLGKNPLNCFLIERDTIMLIKQYNIHIIITWKKISPTPQNIFREWQNWKLDNISLVDGVVWVKITVLLKGGYFCLYIDGLVQNCSISSALTMEILLFCTNPSPINQSNPVLLKERVRIPRTRRARGAVMLWGALPLDGAGSCRLFFTDEMFSQVSVYSMASFADNKFC